MKKVVGIPVTSLYGGARLVEHATLYFIGVVLVNARTVSSSSLEIPTMTSLSSPISVASWLKCGISSRHGGHHVAQMSTITRRPFRSARRNDFPSSVLTSILGAGLPFQLAN